MAVCMSTAIGHEHDRECDAKAANGRTSTVVALRLDDEVAVQLRDLIRRSPAGHESVGNYVKHLITTQALRTR